MGIGVSILLLAVGAILAFAVHVAGHGFDVSTIGVILMAVGGLGLLVALVVGSGATAVRRRAVVDDVTPAPAGRRRVVRETYVD